jgi:hypothetical protein
VKRLKKEHIHGDNMKALFAFILITLLLAGCAAPIGKFAASDQSSGIECCTFIYGNQTKTCTAPDGQSCDVCRQVCDARG